MSISPIDRVSQIYKQNAQAVKGGTNPANADAFKSMLDAAKGVVDNTSAMEKAADDVTMDFITGKTDNIHQVMIAAEKANVALQFTVELRNKAISAYQEIMRLQM